MKTNQEIQDMKKDCAKAIGEVTDGSEDVYKGWIEALNWVTMTNEQPEPVLATRHNDNEVIDVTLTEDIAFEEGFKQGKLAQKKGDELPDGLQKYIDGVGLNILYSNYHKSTNGIWSRAEIVDQGTFEPNFGIETEKEYWEVGVSYGKADDCGSEDYYDKIYVWKVGGSGLQVVTEDYKPVDFAWRYNLQEKV